MATNVSGYDLEIVSKYYIKYRPSYPPELYDRIFKYLHDDSKDFERRGVALDVGCGNGQSTKALAGHFQKVLGIDLSEAQLVEARRSSAELTNVTYRQGSAEELSQIVDDGSVDLITAGTALHWFDQERFFSECRRVLKPGGVLAAYFYQLPFWENQEANELIHKFFYQTMKDYWPTKAYVHFENYKDIGGIMPSYFDQYFRDDSLIIMKFNYTLDEVIGFLKSFPQYTYYKTDHTENPDELDVVTEK